MADREHKLIFPQESADERRFRVRRLLAFLEALPADIPWEFIWKRFRPKRSNAQNRALHGLAYKILEEETGNDPEDMHEYFLGEFTGWELRDVFGQRKRVPKKRSSKMNTVEFADFFTFIQKRAASTVGVYIPDPDPLWWTKEEREHLPAHWGRRAAA